MSSQDPKPLFLAGGELADALRDAKGAGPTPAQLDALSQRLAPWMGPGGGGPGGSGPGGSGGQAASGGQGASGAPSGAGSSIAPAAGAATPWFAGAVIGAAVLGAAVIGGIFMSSTPPDIQSRPTVVANAPAEDPVVATTPLRAASEIGHSSIAPASIAPSEPGAMPSPSAQPIERPRTGGRRLRRGPALEESDRAAAALVTSADDSAPGQDPPAEEDPVEQVPVEPAPVEEVPGELELLSRARGALAGSPTAALEAAEIHRRLYPSGQLAQERELLAIEALVRSSRGGDAQRRADRFRSRWPTSVHLARISAILRP